MAIEYALGWFLAATACLGWPVALALGLSNRARLARIEKLMKGINNA